jgi:hypothetical protein
VSGRLPDCRRSGEVTRLRRPVNQHSGRWHRGERAACQRSGSVAHGILYLCGYVCRVDDVAGDGLRIRSDLGDGWLDSVENRSVAVQPGDLWIIHSLFVHRREPV